MFLYFHLIHNFYRRVMLICYSLYSYKYTNPICKFVKKYEGPADVMNRTCERLIASIVSDHKKKTVCRRRLSHKALFLAARVAYTRRLTTSSAVSDILEEIYNCEQTFIKLFEGTPSSSLTTDLPPAENVF